MREMGSLDHERPHAIVVECLEDSGDLFVHQRREHAAIARVLRQACRDVRRQLATGCTCQETRHTMSDRELHKTMGVDGISRAHTLAAKRRRDLLQ